MASSRRPARFLGDPHASGDVLGDPRRPASKVHGETQDSGASSSPGIQQTTFSVQRQRCTPECSGACSDPDRLTAVAMRRHYAAAYVDE